jgi:hypothetical protein
MFFLNLEPNIQFLKIISTFLTQYFMMQFVNNSSLMKNIEI